MGMANISDDDLDTSYNSNQKPLEPFVLPRDFPLELRYFPKDKQTLRTICEPVTDFKQALWLADHMKIVMRANLGIGLAAPQVGHNVRLILVGTQPVNSTVMINPQIISRTDEQHIMEGCLSFPEMFAKIKRDQQIVVEYQDFNKHTHTLTAQGLLSVCIQHEIDHLDGVLFIDHMSQLKLSMAEKKQHKALAKKKK